MVTANMTDFHNHLFGLETQGHCKLRLYAAFGMIRTGSWVMELPGTMRGDVHGLGLHFIWASFPQRHSMQGPEAEGITSWGLYTSPSTSQSATEPRENRR